MSSRSCSHCLPTWLVVSALSMDRWPPRRPVVTVHADAAHAHAGIPHTRTQVASQPAAPRRARAGAQHSIYS
eukprot:6214103-Pleurochrysis_carterae.AAC.3